MTVLHLLKTTGGARWALLELRELTRRGIDCHVVLPDEDGLTPLYRAAGVRVHILNLDATPFTPKFFRVALALRRLVKRLDARIVHSHFVTTTVLMRCALYGGAPARLFQVPGPLHLENRLTAALELATAGAADYWIASCHWTRARYRELGVPDDRVFLSHYGSDLDSCRRVPGGGLRAELGLGHATRLVGMVAYCYKPKAYLGARRGIKGHEDFVDAVGVLRRQGLDVVGVVAGGAWKDGEGYYEAVKAYARANGDSKVVFLGNRSDVRPVYADLDVAVHPSLSENLGGAAESMLLGVPTVTTSVGGFPDLITDNVTGKMVPPRNPIALAAAIRSLIDDPTRAAALAVEGQRHARALLDVRTTAAQVASVYDQITSWRSSVDARAPLAYARARLKDDV